MAEHLTLLKKLLTERHWQCHRVFCGEYARAAAHVDRALVSTAPSRSQFQRWLTGGVAGLPYADHCRVLEAMFPGHSAAQLFAPVSTSGATDPVPAMLEPSPRDRRRDTTTDRRDALKVGGVLTAGYVVDALLTEPDNLHAALDTTSISDERLTALENDVEALGVAVIRATDHYAAIPEILGRFRTVRMLLERRQRTSHQVRLTVVAAKLAVVIGNLLFDEGQYPAATHWYDAAGAAALDAGDRYVADMALGGRAYIPAYSGDPHGVLALVEPRLNQGVVTPSPAVAFLWASKARAHASLGEAIGFRHAINRSRQALDASPADRQYAGEHSGEHGIFTFLPGRLAFYEATGCAKLGDAHGATEAADRALAVYDMTLSSDPALIRLDKAIALAKSRQIPEATTVAAHALMDPHTYPSSSVRTRAREFDALLGDPRTAAVRDWREVLATVFPQTGG